jgi:hypothetical protein
MTEINTHLISVEGDISAEKLALSRNRNISQKIQVIVSSY